MFLCDEMKIFIAEFNEITPPCRMWWIQSSYQRTKSSWACSTKYCRVQRNLYHDSEGSCTRGRPWSEIEAVSAVPYDKAVALAACHQPGVLSAYPAHRVGDEKLPCGKPVSAINTGRKSQAASHWGLWKIPPLFRIWCIPPYTSVRTRVLSNEWVNPAITRLGNDPREDSIIIIAYIYAMILWNV